MIILIGTFIFKCYKNHKAHTIALIYFYLFIFSITLIFEQIYTWPNSVTCPVSKMKLRWKPILPTNQLVSLIKILCTFHFKYSKWLCAQGEKVNTKTSESPLQVGTKLQIKFVMLFTYSQIRWHHHLLYNLIIHKICMYLVTLSNISLKNRPHRTTVCCCSIIVSNSITQLSIMSNPDFSM